MTQVEAAAAFAAASQDFDPLVLRLAQLVGLLGPTAADGTCSIDAGWFEDPLSALKAIPSERAAQVLDLLEELLGSASGSSLGAPQRDAGRLWYPLPVPGADGAPTPFYLVAPAQRDAGAGVVLGFGVHHALHADPSTVTAFAHLPLLEFGATGKEPRFVLGTGVEPIQLGFELKGATLAAGGVSFSGVQLALDLHLDGPPQVELVFLDLALPGLPVADRSLQQVRELGPDAWIAGGLSLVASQLFAACPPERRSAIEAMLDDALALLGLTPELPNVGWWSLLTDPAKAGAHLLEWVGAVAGSEATLRRWLETLGSLVAGARPAADATPRVTGRGVRDDPYAVSLADAGGIEISLTAATEAQPGSGVDVYPGLRISVPPHRLEGLPTTVVASAQAELARIAVPPGATGHVLFPSFDLGITFANADPAQPLLAADSPVGRLSVGTARASLACSGEGRVPQPSFALADVRVGASRWATIGLLDVDEVVHDAQQAATEIVRAAIERFLGVGTAAGGPAAALAGLLGVVQPPALKSTDWSVEPLLLDPSELEHLVADPLGALGAYWARALTTPEPAGGGPAFRYLLPCLAALLGGDPRAGPTGSGTRADPWRATVHDAGDAGVLAVTAWTASAGSAAAQELQLGLAIVMTPEVEGAVFELTLGADLLDLQLPVSGGGSPAVGFFASAALSLLVHGPLEPLALGGVSLGASGLVVSGGWDRGRGAFGDVEIDGAALTAGTLDVELGRLAFGPDGATWDKPALGPPLVPLLGLWLVEHGGRVGVALAALLGLLPEASYPLPPGFELPHDWPVLGSVDLAAPFPAIRAQLREIAGRPDAARAALRLLAWGLTETLPQTAGSGSADDPYCVTLTGLASVQPLLWCERAGDGSVAAAGFGVQRTTSLQDAGPELEAAVLARLDLGRVALSGPAPVAPAPVPRARVVLRCTNPTGGPVLAAGGVQIGSARLGGAYGPGGGEVVVTLFEATVGGGVARGTVDLAGALASTDAMQTLSQLLAALLDLLAAHAGGSGAKKPALDAALDVLEAIGLVHPQDGGRGVVPAAWLALLADPGAYLVQHADAIDGADLAALAGRDSLALPDVLVAVLEAFGLAAPAAWIALAAHPLAYAESRAASLFDDPQAVRDLVSRLAASRAPGPLPHGLSLTVENGTRVTLALPTAPIGSELAAAGSLTLDLRALSLTGDACVWSTRFGAGAGATFAVSTDADTAWELDLRAAPTGAFAALPPFALAGSTRPDLLAELETAAPPLVLSTIAAALLNGYVLPASPLAARILEQLGLATGSPARAGSLVGALVHPGDWLKSPAAFGDGRGRLSFAKLAHALVAIADGGVRTPAGIGVTASEDGVLTVTGLPLADTLTLGAVGERLTFATTLAAADHGLEFRLAPKLVYDGRTGVAVEGTLAATIPVGADSVLAVQGGFGAAGFTLDFRARQDTTSFPAKGPLALVPFPGLGTYLSDSGDLLLEVVATNALAAYRRHDPRPKELTALHDGLIQAAAAVGVTSVGSLVDAVDELADRPLAWLASAFRPDNLPRVVGQLRSLIGTTLALPGVTAERSLLRYEPPFAGGALSFLVGERTLDGSTVLGAWVEPTVRSSPLVLAVTAGVGLQTPIAPDAPQLDLTLEASAGLEPGLLSPLKGAPTLRARVERASDAWTLAAGFYPVGDDPAAPTPAVALLPQPLLAFADDPTKKAEVDAWLRAFLLDFATPLVADAVLATGPVRAWLAEPVAGGAPLSQVLEELKLLEQVGTETPPRFAPLDPRDAFAHLTWEKIAERLVGVALEAVALPPPGRQLVAVAGGAASLVREPSDGGACFGLELQLPAIPLTSDPAASPKVVLQLGAWPSLDGGKEHWIADASPGLVVRLVRVDAQGGFAFAPGVELVSVGVDVLGTDAKPLVDAGGFRLRGIETRTYLSLGDHDGTFGARFGVLAQCDAIGLPLGRKPGGHNDSNPVAANLLSSADSDGGAPGKSVTPTFGASVSWVDGGSFQLALHGDEKLGDTADAVWLPVQRALGPLYCRRIGIGWDARDTSLDLGFDGVVSLAGLALDLDDLSIGIPVKTPLDYSQYTLGLDGLEVAFAGGPVSIAGGLMHTGSGGYAGLVVLRAQTFGVSAMGGYSVIPDEDGGTTGDPSLFVFGLVTAAIGGPPAFHVLAVAAGFGYNRDLLLPAQDSVASFPLVAGVRNPSGTFPAGNDPTAAFRVLETYIPPRVGRYWLAAGVEFTSFELLSTIGLLAVSFGTEVVVALVGTSTLTVPSNPQGAQATSIAKATLQLESVFRPATGTVSATATLTSDSWVLDPSARLTGGFAFALWYGEDHSGDFVVTLGGYHPAYRPPDHYPREPRLGLDWPLGPVQVTGGCYFALTPAVAMAGGALAVTYQAGNLKAWFDATADFVVYWKPFHFRAGIGVSLGASYRVDALFIHHTFTIELGASLDLWGPPVGGTVHVDWFVISFTVGFGPSDAGPRPLASWAEFDASFLPQRSSGGALAAAASAPPEPKVTVQPAGGLLKNVDGDPTHWLINPLEFRLVTSSVVPSTLARFNDADVAHGPAVGVRPLGRSSLESTHAIRLVKHDDAGHDSDVDAEHLKLEPVSGNVPQALWSTSGDSGLGGPTVVDGALVGVAITPKSAPVHATDPFPIASFEGESVSVSVDWPALEPPADPTYPQTDTVDALMTALGSDSVAARRRDLLAALAETSPHLDRSGDLPVLGRFADQVLQAPPSLVALGGQLPLAGAEVLA